LVTLRTDQDNLINYDKWTDS